MQGRGGHIFTCQRVRGRAESRPAVHDWLLGRHRMLMRPDRQLRLGWIEQDLKSGRLKEKHTEGRVR